MEGFKQFVMMCSTPHHESSFLQHAKDSPVKNAFHGSPVSCAKLFNLLVCVLRLAGEDCLLHFSCYNPESRHMKSEATLYSIEMI